jgi:alpha-mannosidase
VGRSTGEDWDPKGSQLLDSYTFRYGLLPHSGDWTEGDLVKESLAMVSGLRVTQSIAHEGSLPQCTSLIEIEPAQLSFDGLKKADGRDSLILRFHNPTPHDLDAKIKVGLGTLKEAWQTNFLEVRGENVEVKEGNILEGSAPAHKVVTLELVVDN